MLPLIRHGCAAPPSPTGGRQEFVAPLQGAAPWLLHQPRRISGPAGRFVKRPCKKCCFVSAVRRGRRPLQKGRIHFPTDVIPRNGVTRDPPEKQPSGGFLAALGMTAFFCHPEERSDEGSFFRFLAVLGMTEHITWLPLEGKLPNAVRRMR